MKRIVLVLGASILLLGAAAGQAPPDHPKPVAQNGALWDRVKELPRGQLIVVKNTYGPPLHCRFDGATDAFLFCYPPDAPQDTTDGYQFERASVLDVTVPHHLSIPHPGVLASATVAGVVLGLGSTRTLSDGDSAKVGLISALVVGTFGLGMSAVPRDGVGFGFAYHPHGFGLRVPFGRRFAPGRPIRRR